MAIRQGAIMAYVQVAKNAARVRQSAKKAGIVIKIQKQPKDQQVDEQEQSDIM